MNTKYTDWIDYFDAVPSRSFTNKGCMKVLFKTFNATVSINEVMNQVVKHSKTVYLASLSLRLGIKLFHHFIQVGGTVYSDNKKAGFFLGVNKPTAVKMTPDIDVLFTTPHKDTFKVAKKENILNRISLEDLNNLSDSNTSSYSARNFIPIHPFLIQTVVSSISANQGNAKKILLKVVSSIQKIDKTFD